MRRPSQTVAPTPRTLASAHERARALVRADPLWFKRAVFYEIHIRGVLRRQRRRLRRLPRADREARLPAVARRSTASGCCRCTPRRSATAATTSPTSTASIPTTARSRTSAPSSRPAHERGMRVIADLVMNHTSSDHPWFQESRSDPDSPKRRLVRLVGHDRALPGRADHLPRHRGLELDVGPGRAGSTTGTASSATSPT